MKELIARAQELELAMKPVSEMVQQVVDDDEAEAFPSEVAGLLADQSVLHDFIPVAQGGRLQTLTGLMSIARVLARRNLTSAIALAQTFLGVLPVWIAGNNEQKARAAEILKNDGLNCLALTEELYGSDLQGNQVTITELDDEHFQIQGEKWCINNATKGKALSLFARSNEAGGEQGFSLLYVDKEAIDLSTTSNIPALRTHGIRGADISGINFHSTPIKKTAVLDRVGKGLNITLRTLQISRTLCAGLSLGAGDAALRMAADFVIKRQLYGESVSNINAVRGKLAGCFRDLMMAEAMGMVMSRACTRMPEQMSVYSAVVKYLVPTMVDEQIRVCGVLLGGRGYLREGDYPLFQKMKRDHAVVALFDGSTEVNLYVISGQLRALLKQDVSARKQQLSWQEIFDLNAETPSFTGDGLKLSNRGRDFVWEGLRALNVDSSALRSVCQTLLQQHSELVERFTVKEGELDQMSNESFKLVQHYCELTAKALYVQFWLHNREWFSSDLLRSDEWLNYMVGEGGKLNENSVFDVITKQLNENKLFSHGQFDLAG